MTRKPLYTIILIAIICISNNAYGQKKSDLYAPVDSIIINRLLVDKKVKENKIKEKLSGTSLNSSTVIIKCVSSIETKPLIVLNQQPVSPEELNNYTLAEIASLEVLNGPEITAIYGVSGFLGVIVIYTKKKEEKS